MRNENVTIYGCPWLDSSAWAWCRPPGIPDWRVYVKYGDSGYEVDPGIYGESLDTAIDKVGQALGELEKLYYALRKFKVKVDWE